MQLGNLIAVPAVAIVALLFRRYRLVIASVIVGGGKWYSSRLLKDVFLRERPASVISDVLLRDAPAAGQAFVSGHAVIAVGLAVVVHPHVGRKWQIVVWSPLRLYVLRECTSERTFLSTSWEGRLRDGPSAPWLT